MDKLSSGIRLDQLNTADLEQLFASHNNFHDFIDEHMDKEQIKVLIDQMTDEEKIALDIKYVHDETHPAEMIVETDDLTFVSNAERADWNARVTQNELKKSQDEQIIPANRVTETEDILFVSPEEKAAWTARQTAEQVRSLVKEVTVMPEDANLNTLTKISESLGDDADFAGTMQAALDTKVDKVEGKALSDNNFTDELLDKLNGIEENSNKYIHPASGVVAGTYKSVTVDVNGHVTGGTNPTTLEGYGITDADALGSADQALEDAKAYTDDTKDALISDATTYKTFGAVEDKIANMDAKDADLQSQITADKNDLAEHEADMVKHITADERAKWNASQGNATSYADAKKAEILGDAETYKNLGLVENKIEALDAKDADLQSQINTDKSNLATHDANTTKHITAAERTKWNASEGNAKAYTDDAKEELLGDAETYTDLGKVEDKIASLDATDNSLQNQVTTNKNNFSTHDANTTKHITAAERTAWNAAQANAIAQAKEYTDGRFDDLIGGASETLDTLKEIETAFAENSDVIESINNAITTKADKTTLNSHTSNTTVHITAAERTAWNAAQANATSAAKTYTDTSVSNAKSALTGDAKTYTTLGKVEDKIEALVSTDTSLQSQITTNKNNLSSHDANTTKHITSAERTAWNAAEGNAKAYTDDAKEALLGDAETYTDLGLVEDKIASMVSTDSSLQTQINTNKNNLSSHTGNTTVHITAAERTAWNAAEKNAKSYADSSVATAKSALLGDAKTYTTLGKAEDKIEALVSTDTSLQSQITTNKNNLSSHTGNTTVHITASERTKWNAHQTNVIESISKNGTAIEVDDEKNVNITVPTKVSELSNDAGYIKSYVNTTYTISKSGSTITLTGSDGSKTTVTDSNTTYSVASSTANGLMSKTDKAKLDGIAEGANKYVLPTAGSTLGGVKTTSTVTSTSGYTACPIISGVPYYKDTNTTYNLGSFGITATAAELNVLDGITATVTELNYCDGVTSNIQTQLNGKASTAVATASANGLMAKADKSKLDGIAAGANNYTHPSTHAASMITQSASYRFVTDTEKAAWNAKANVKCGTSAFKGNSTGVTIAHGLGAKPSAVIVTPTANASGTLGEYWVTYDATNIVVYNTGEAVTAFNWVAFK